MSRARYPKLIYGPDGKPLCRGCGGAVPAHRQTWCSSECYHKHCPQAVVSQVKKRDKEICQKCGYNYLQAYEFWFKSQPKFSNPGYLNWKNSEPDAPEYHHIVPFSEGGKHTLENMTTLCHKCHAEVTKLWRRSKKPANIQAELSLK